MNLVEIKLHNRNLNSKSTLEVEKLSENSLTTFIEAILKNPQVQNEHNNFWCLWQNLD